MSTLPELLLEFNPADIYNADETGRYYHATPDGSLCYAYEQLSSSKKAINRITVPCCANMSGSNKCKLLVIGKSKKPHCFAGINVECLPVTYRANKNAWMTSVLFEEWITNWDAALAREGRKILVLVDNCTAHPYTSEHTTGIFTTQHNLIYSTHESGDYQKPEDLLQEETSAHDSCRYRRQSFQLIIYCYRI